MLRGLDIKRQSEPCLPQHKGVCWRVMTYTFSIRLRVFCFCWPIRPRQPQIGPSTTRSRLISPLLSTCKTAEDFQLVTSLHCVQKSTTTPIILSVRSILGAFSTNSQTHKAPSSTVWAAPWHELSPTPCRFHAPHHPAPPPLSGLARHHHHDPDCTLRASRRRSRRHCHLLARRSSPRILRPPRP